MSAVSNASPLILLAKAGCLDLLKTLYGEIHIPRAVHEEVTGGDSPDVAAIQAAVQAGWIRAHETDLQHPSGAPKVTGLHDGEAEAIRLALALRLPLIMDDRQGTSTARALGVKTWGSVAVLLDARRSGLVSHAEFARLLDRLVDQGFWLGADTYRTAIEASLRLDGTARAV